MGDSNADCCCCTPCADGGNCTLPYNHAGEHYSDKEMMLDYLNPTRHVIAAKDAEIAALKAEVESKDATIKATRRHIDRHKRALAAGPAALRKVEVNLYPAQAAEIVERAQADAMKEKP